MEPLHSCRYKKIFASSLANMWPADVAAEIVSLGRKELEKRKGRKIDKQKMFLVGTTDSMAIWN